MVEYSISEMLPDMPNINLGSMGDRTILCDIYGVMQPWINWMNQALGIPGLFYFDIFWGYHLVANSDATGGTTPMNIPGVVGNI